MPTVNRSASSSGPGMAVVRRRDSAEHVWLSMGVPPDEARERQAAVDAMNGNEMNEMMKMKNPPNYGWHAAQSRAPAQPESFFKVSL